MVTTVQIQREEMTGLLACNLIYLQEDLRAEVNFAPWDGASQRQWVVSMDPSQLLLGSLALSLADCGTLGQGP